MELMISTTAKHRCPLCEREGKVHHEDLRDWLFGVPGLWSLRRCNDSHCGLLWLDPCPVEADISKAYLTYYTHADTEKKPLIRSHLVAVIRDFCVGVVTTLCGQRQEKKDIAHMYLRDLPPGRILDVGCGDAKFLDRMKQAGWEVQGLDFDAAAAHNAKKLFGIDVQIGKLEDMQFPDGTFDAVTMNHVIEHVFDPVALVGEVRRILKPGGRLVMVTPNAMSVGHRVFGRSWRGLEPPRHIQIFTPSSLDTVARSAGLAVNKVFTTAVNSWIIFSASSVLQRHHGLCSTTNLCGHEKPTRGEQIKGLKLQLREAFRLKQHPADGEEIVLIAVKEPANPGLSATLPPTDAA